MDLLPGDQEGCGEVFFREGKGGCLTSQLVLRLHWRVSGEAAVTKEPTNSRILLKTQSKLCLMVK